MISLPFDKPLLMGILNYTPDSFSDGGLYNTPAKACNRISEMISEGADIIDIGACSTRPGSVFATKEEERARLSEILPLARREFSVPISVDTFYPENIEYVLSEGADIANDVGGVFCEETARAVRDYNACWVVMHGGVLSGIKEGSLGGSVTASVQSFFDEMLEKTRAFGIDDKKIILDPGFGFGKDTDENSVLFKELSSLKTYGCHFLVALSRKRFIGALSGDSGKSRLPGTLAADVLAVNSGATMIRSHEIGMHRKAVDFAFNLNKY